MVDLPPGCTVRPYVPPDARVAARLQSRVFAISPESLDKQLRQPSAGGLVEVVQRGSDVVALLEVRPQQGDRVGLRLIVDEELRGQGLGGALLERSRSVLASARPGGYLRAAVNSDDEESLRWATSRGFREVAKSVSLSRPLSESGEQLAATARGAAVRAGVRITPWLGSGRGRSAEAGLDWAWLTQLLSDCSVGLLDSGAAPVTESMTRYLVPWPDGVHIAWRGEHPVGLVSIAPEEDSTFYCWFTGVVPNLRRSGVAVALKTAAAYDARNRGGDTLKTNNDRSNVPMLRLNEELGYVRTGGNSWLHGHA